MRGQMGIRTYLYVEPFYGLHWNDKKDLTPRAVIEMLRAFTFFSHFSVLLLWTIS